MEEQRDRQQDASKGAPQEGEQQSSSGAASIDPRTGKKDDGTAIFLTGNSTLQTPEEDINDSSIDPRMDDTMSPSDDDLRESAADRFAGSDRAGTAERKDNSMDES